MLRVKRARWGQEYGKGRAWQHGRPHLLVKFPFVNTFKNNWYDLFFPLPFGNCWEILSLMEHGYFRLGPSDKKLPFRFFILELSG